MPKVGEIVKKKVIRYGREYEIPLKFCADGRFHFCGEEKQKSASAAEPPPGLIDNGDDFDPLDWGDS